MMRFVVLTAVMRVVLSATNLADGFVAKDVQFYLPENTVPEDSHVVILAGGHPKKSSTIWSLSVETAFLSVRHSSSGRSSSRRSEQAGEGAGG